MAGEIDQGQTLRYSCVTTITHERACALSISDGVSILRSLLCTTAAIET